MKLVLSIFLILLVSYFGCYSFTGSSVPVHLKTIAIPLFDDQSGSGEPGLRENITNKLVDKFRQDHSLEIADRASADCSLEGTILSMADQPQVVTAGETVTKRRLTISVKVIYQDMKLKKKIWEKQFSGWSDYRLGGDITQRDSCISAANEKLTDDILLNTVSGW
jgi:hypothetical protein